MLPPHKQYTTSDREQAARLRAEARNPATPEKRLRDMAFNRTPLERRVLEALVANPSTPPDALAHLVGEVPAAFCRNPIAPLLALEQPDFLEKLSGRAVRQMLRSPRAPVTLVAQVVASADRVLVWGEDLAEAARLHVTQQAEEIPDQEWAEHVRRYWQEYARPACWVDRQRHELYELAELTAVPVEWASDGNAPLEVNDYADFLRRAGAEYAPQMEQAYQKPPERRFPSDGAHIDRTLYTFVAAAFSPWALPDYLETWSEQHPDLALAAAQNPNASPALLEKLARHQDPGVRRAALRHPALPPGARETCRRLLFRRVLRLDGFHQEWLLQAAYLLVRFVAMQEAPDTLRRPAWHRYARSPLWQDRLAVAVSIGPRPNGQPPRPRHLVLLRHLSNDGNILVRAAARARLRGETFRF